MKAIKIRHTIFGVIGTAGFILVLGAAGASDTGAEISNFIIPAIAGMALFVAGSIGGLR